TPSETPPEAAPTEHLGHPARPAASRFCCALRPLTPLRFDHASISKTEGDERRTVVLYGVRTVGKAVRVQARTDAERCPYESDCGDGSGCGNGRDDAGGAARALRSDKRCHR